MHTTIRQWRSSRAEGKHRAEGTRGIRHQACDLAPRPGNDSELIRGHGQSRPLVRQAASGTKPDLGIIAQLDSAQPESTTVGTRSPLGTGGLIRHRIRRQLHGAFLSESRQARLVAPSGEYSRTRWPAASASWKAETTMRQGSSSLPRACRVQYAGGEEGWLRCSVLLRD